MRGPAFLWILATSGMLRPPWPKLSQPRSRRLRKVSPTGALSHIVPSSRRLWPDEGDQLSHRAWAGVGDLGPAPLAVLRRRWRVLLGGGRLETFGKLAKAPPSIGTEQGQEGEVNLPEIMGACL